VSHVTSSLVTIGDLDILKKALTKFPKLKWHEGQKTYAWYNRFQDDWGKQNEHKTARARGINPSQYGKCESAISLPGCAYEIGVTKREDGQGWSLVWDVWRGQAISEYIGEDAQLLMCEYSRLYCEQYALSAGYISNTTEDEDYFRVEMNQL
jgi:hypothetical protein